MQIEQIDGLVAAAGIDATREILDAFWRSTTDLIAALENQINQNELVLAAQTAHAVKGSAANVGALRLSKTANQFEQSCKQSDLDGAKQALALLQQDFIDVRNHFETHLAKG